MTYTQWFVMSPTIAFLSYRRVSLVNSLVKYPMTEKLVPIRLVRN